MLKSEGTPIISIVVPIYGVEKYLERCIRSVLAQSIDDFELLLVVDGSPDDCAQIADEFCAFDKRIVVIHKRNSGVSAARNRGLFLARGEYVGFVDPDDWIEPERFCIVISLMQQTNADVGVCGWKNSDGTTLRAHGINLPVVLDAEAYSCELFARPRSVFGSVWNKVFRRNLIEQVFEEQVGFCEDGLFLCWYARRMEKACIVPDTLYVVYLNPTSATRAEVGRVTLGLPVRRKMVDVISPLGTRSRQAAQADFLDNCLLCLGMRDAAPQYIQLARDEFVSYLSHHLLEVLCNDQIRPMVRALYVAKAIELLFCKHTMFE